MRAHVAAIAVGAAVLALTACEPSVSELKPGDCFNQAELASELNSVSTVACSEPHDSEVYFVFDLTIAEFDQDAIDAAAGDTCEAEYQNYVGIPYWDSAYLFLSFTPTEEGWRNEEQHQAICFVWPGEGILLTDTVKDSRD